MTTMTAASPGIEDAFVEAQVQQLLHEAGLESAPFDPASFEALKKYMQQKSINIQATIPQSSSSGTEKPALVCTQQEEQSPLPLLAEDPDPVLPLLHVDIYGPTTTTTASTSAVASAPLEQRQALFIRNMMGSDVTDPGSSERRVVPLHNNNMSNISAISGASATTTRTEARILEQLQVQTALILQLQRRVDELTALVCEQKEQKQQQPFSRGVGPPRQLSRFVSELSLDEDSETKQRSTFALSELDSADSSSQQRLVVDRTPTFAEEAISDGDAPTEAAVAPAAALPPPLQQARPVVAAPRAPAAPGLFRRLLLRPLEATRNSRMAKLYQVYTKMRKQQVQDIQWGVIVKVVVMLSILLGRVMSRSSRQQQKQQSKDGDGESSFSLYSNVPFKVYALVVVAFVGLLTQVGYLRFWYKFLIQERYPQRILVLGEDADAILQELEELGRPDPQRRAAAAAQQQAAGDPNNNAAALMNWDQTFLLGGRIAPRRGGNNNENNNNNNNNPGQEQQPQQQQAPGVVAVLGNVIYDIVYLIGSFFLSIFPMWRPQPLPRPAAAGEEEQPTPPHDQDQQRGPGQVRPPEDPAANDDDEEDDGEHEEDGDY